METLKNECRAEASVKLGGARVPLTNFWNAVHFHPTDAIEDDWGRAILDRVAADGAARTVRMYAMLEDIVTMDESGKLRYDFTLNDVRMDYMVRKGFRLLVSYNFIPPCIAEKPQIRSSVSKNKTRYKGKMIVTSAPKDYGLWEEICREYTRHIVERYGEETVGTWYLQCFNEPDIREFFLGDLPDNEEGLAVRLREYVKLYRGFANGICAVSQKLRLGGPAKAWFDAFLEGFLDAVIAEGLRLDYVCVHAYGTEPPKLNAGGSIDPAYNVDIIRRARAILDRKFPDRVMPLVVDEWGAATCGYFNRDECPALMFRESEVLAAFFGSFVLELLDGGLGLEQLMMCLSGQHEMTEDFSGFRNLFTLHGIRKPIYNAYCLMNRLGSERLPAVSSDPRIRLLATAEGEKTRVLLIYAPERFRADAETVTETLTFEGLEGEREIGVYRIDRTHTNPYALYLEKGFSPALTDEQLRLLTREGELKPARETLRDGKLELTLPPNSFVFLELD